MANKVPPRLGLEPGSGGRPMKVVTNSYWVKGSPGNIFTHYDDFPEFKKFPNRERALILVDRLHNQHQTVFHPRGAYDGQRNMYRATPLKLPGESATFKVYYRTDATKPEDRAKQHPTIVKITRVTTIDPNSLLPLINGQAGYNHASLTSLSLLNVLIRMKPIMTYPSHGSSFYTKDIRSELGGGLEMWRGLFQSIRPTVNRLLVNIDVTSAVMYCSGPLVDLLMSFLNIKDTRHLCPRYLKHPAETRLNSFLKGLKVYSKIPPSSEMHRKYRRIQRIVMAGADDTTFYHDKDEEEMSITTHFHRAYRHRMQYGGAICVDVGTTRAKPDEPVIYPIEVLNVKEGQFYRKVLPSALLPQALKFSTQKPDDRLRGIERAGHVFSYSESDWIRQAGLVIEQRLVNAPGRVLQPPSIQWGAGQKPDEPTGGAWNVLHRKFYDPAVVKAWSAVCYDSRLGQQQILHFLKSFMEACTALGMKFPSGAPQILNGRPGADSRAHHEDMERGGSAAIETFDSEFQRGDSKRPTFIMVILPDSAIDIKTSIKNWGDCIRGCPTQCVKSGKVSRANNQYYNNLALKLNTKIGGVNSIPSAGGATMKFLGAMPTMVIGADVSHAGPGSDRPSITGLVSSVDEHFTRYVASTGLQEARVEILTNLEAMIENAVKKFYQYWKFSALPQRIIFYRDGVSEGQFDEVTSKEVNTTKACLTKIWKEKKLPGTPPKLTFIVVGKKHHVRFFPTDSRDADRSGNCPAGMVVDQEVISPVYYDFYLQSHGGLIGTSRPSHYSVIQDENKLGANMLQSISYTLCHVYARATRSVSIPAPVYYADIVCNRGRFHSKLIHDGADMAVSTSSGERLSLIEHQRAFQSVSVNMDTSMYFM